jgi:CYTH domain-containing protein
VDKNLEIERKFLVKHLPNGWKGKTSSHIVQGYFPTFKAIEIRLRRKDSHHFLTVKAGQGHKRQEEEIEISKAQFRALWPLTRGAQISKTRYKILHRGKTIEMNAYHGRYRGTRFTNGATKMNETDAKWRELNFRAIFDRQQMTNL